MRELGDHSGTSGHARHQPDECNLCVCAYVGVGVGVGVGGGVVCTSGCCVHMLWGYGCVGVLWV